MVKIIIMKAGFIAGLLYKTALVLAVPNNLEIECTYQQADRQV